MLFIFSSIGFWGCEQDSFFENTYSEYLDLETFETSKMSENDMKIMGEALQRLDINKVNGLYQIEQTSGKQVNISERLFDYLITGFNYTNKLFSQKSLDSTIMRVKSDNIEDEPQDSTHCASYALAEWGVSYDDAAAYSDSTYGEGGVPADSMESFIQNFYPNATSSSTSDLSTGAMGTNLLYFQTSDTTGHAVNAIFYDSGSNLFMYDDPQTGERGTVSGDEVLGIYFP